MDNKTIEEKKLLTASTYSSDELDEEPENQTDSFDENALKHFDEDIPVCIFSDDSEWCHQQKMFESDRFFISDTESTGIDLCLMAMCTYHIIANSSYSWWGSYLAKSKKTIAPSDWFGDELKKTKDIKNLYRQGWEII